MHQNEISSRRNTDRPSLPRLVTCASLRACVTQRLTRRGGECHRTIRSIRRKVCNARTNGSRAQAGTNSSVFQTLDPTPWRYKLLRPSPDVRDHRTGIPEVSADGASSSSFLRGLDASTLEHEGAPLLAVEPQRLNRRHSRGRVLASWLSLGTRG